MARGLPVLDRLARSEPVARVEEWLRRTVPAPLRQLHKRLRRRGGGGPGALDIAIAALGADRPLSFVQVGANDGRTGDPIFPHVQRYGGRALLIEPQPWLINDLRASYAGFAGALTIEPIAIGPSAGTLRLHILRQADWETYTARVGRHPSAIFSPDRDQVLRRVAPRLGLSRAEAETRLEAIEVPMRPLSEVLAQHGFDTVDVLQIDCEGWDVEVIESLGPARPLLINFESFNLAPADWDRFLRWSAAHGYGFLRGRKDTLAIRGLRHPR